MSLHQEHGAAALDLASNPAMQVRRHSSNAAGKNFATLGDEFFQKIGVLVINSLNGDVDPAARHGAIRAAKSGTTFGGLRAHLGLFRLAVQSVASQERIVFLLLESIGRARTFLVPRSHVTGDGFAQSFRLGAFQRNNFLRHSLSLLCFRRRNFLFFGFAAFFFCQAEQRRDRLTDP